MDGKCSVQGRIHSASSKVCCRISPMAATKSPKDDKV